MMLFMEERVTIDCLAMLEMIALKATLEMIMFEAAMATMSYSVALGMTLFVVIQATTSSSVGQETISLSADKAVIYSCCHPVMGWISSVISSKELMLSGSPRNFLLALSALRSLKIVHGFHWMTRPWLKYLV